MPAVLKKALIICCIIISGYTLWYFGGVNDLWMKQWYFMREFLSSSYKIIWMLIPTAVLLERYIPKRYLTHSTWWTYAFIITAIILILGKKYLSTFLGTWNSIALPLTYFYVIIVNSFVEEFTFRWVFLTAFRKHYTSTYSILLQAWLFALIHIPLYLYMSGLGVNFFLSLMMLFCIGWFLGYVQNKTDSLIYPILFHTLWNSIILFI
jgi:membrane protease YdiL (CAAX protease family)